MIAFADLAGQSALIGQLQSDFARGRYVHAYLLTGPGGTGKRSAAQLCAMAALCRGKKKPCGACGPCRRVLSGTHPDVHTVVPEKGKQIIKESGLNIIPADDLGDAAKKAVASVKA